MGNDESARLLLETVAIEGFVDDYAAEGSLRFSKPVLSSSQLPAGSFVVNTSTSISPVSVAKKMSAVGSRLLAYADLCRFDSKRFLFPDFVIEMREDMAENAGQWQHLREQLADPESQLVLDNLMMYRLTADSQYMEGYSVRFRDQYFENFLGLGPGEVFVDCGGFDGDTTEEFCRRCPAYK